MKHRFSFEIFFNFIDITCVNLGLSTFFLLGNPFYYYSRWQAVVVVSLPPTEDEEEEEDVRRRVVMPHDLCQCLPPSRNIFHC